MGGTVGGTVGTALATDALAAPPREPNTYAPPATATSAPTPRAAKRPALLDAGAPSIEVAERDTEGAVAGPVWRASNCGTVAPDAIGGAPASCAPGTEPPGTAGEGEVSVMPRIGAMATASRRAFQKSAPVCHRSAGFTETALASTASTGSLTVAPRARGVGRRSAFPDETASCKKSSPSSASRPVSTSTTMSAIANTSVHGPVDPCARENCSGAP